MSGLSNCNKKTGVRTLMLSTVLCRKKISDQIEFFRGFLQGIDLQISLQADEKIESFTPRVLSVNANVVYSSVGISIRYNTRGFLSQSSALECSWLARRRFSLFPLHPLHNVYHRLAWVRKTTECRVQRTRYDTILQLLRPGQEDGRLASSDWHLWHH